MGNLEELYNQLKNKTNINKSEIYLLRGIEMGNRYNKNMVIIESIWDNEVNELVKILRKNGIKEILIADNSSALMNILSNFIDNDCKIIGNEKLEKNFLGNINITNTLKIEL